MWKGRYAQLQPHRSRLTLGLTAPSHLARAAGRPSCSFTMVIVKDTTIEKDSDAMSHYRFWDVGQLVVAPIQSCVFSVVLRESWAGVGDSASLSEARCASSFLSSSSRSRKRKKEQSPRSERSYQNVSRKEKILPDRAYQNGCISLLRASSTYKLSGRSEHCDELCKLGVRQGGERNEIL